MDNVKSADVMPFVTLEVLLDAPSLRSGVLKLAFAPAAPKSNDAAGWAEAYGAMVSYESALDAAGYTSEAQMRKSDAPIFVTMADIREDGSIHARFGTFNKDITAREAFAAHDLPLPGDEPEPDTDGMTP